MAATAASAADMFVYFGTHRSGPNIGFSLAHFDTDTGVLTKPEFLLEAPAPAFFVIHPDGRHLYTCNSGNTGRGSAYEIEPHTGASHVSEPRSRPAAATPATSASTKPGVTRWRRITRAATSPSSPSSPMAASATEPRSCSTPAAGQPAAPDACLRPLHHHRPVQSLRPRRRPRRRQGVCLSLQRKGRLAAAERPALCHRQSRLRRAAREISSQWQLGLSASTKWAAPSSGSTGIRPRAR